MACGCAPQIPTYLQAGTGVRLTGIGTETQPYRIEVATSDSALTFAATNTVALKRTGAGTTASPFEVTGDVRLDAQGGLASGPNGVAVNLDTNPGNILSLTSGGRLRASGSAAVLVSDTGGIKDTETGLAVKLDPASPVPIVGTTAGLSVGPIDASGPAATVDARLSLMEQADRHMFQMVGGGNKRANGSYVKWDAKFYAIGARNGSMGASFYEIDVPANGVTITGTGGAASVTVPSSGTYAGMVPLGDWQSLWYLPPSGSSATYVPANLRIVSYTALATLPDNAILIAQRSGMNDKAVRWGDGSIYYPWRDFSTSLRGAGGNVTLGSGGFQRMRYRVANNMCEVQYYLRWGSNGSAPGGDLYVPIPVRSAVAGGDLDREFLGLAKFFSAAGGDWGGQTWLANDYDVMHFLLPTTSNDCTLKRYRTWDGSNGDGSTAWPRISPTGAVPNSPNGSILTGQIEYPVAVVPL